MDADSVQGKNLASLPASSFREIEEAGLVTRRQYPEIPVRAAHNLTEKALELAPDFEILGQWGKRRLEERKKKRLKTTPARTLSGPGLFYKRGRPQDPGETGRGTVRKAGTSAGGGLPAFLGHKPDTAQDHDGSQEIDRAQRLREKNGAGE